MSVLHKEESLRAIREKKWCCHPTNPTHVRPFGVQEADRPSSLASCTASRLQRATAASAIADIPPANARTVVGPAPLPALRTANELTTFTYTRTPLFRPATTKAAVRP